MMMASDKKNRVGVAGAQVLFACIAAHNLLSNINSVFIRVLVRVGGGGAYTENNRRFARAPLPRMCAAVRCQ